MQWRSLIILAEIVNVAVCVERRGLQLAFPSQCQLFKRESELFSDQLREILSIWTRLYGIVYLIGNSMFHFRSANTNHHLAT